MRLDPTEARRLIRLRDELPAFGKVCLTVRTKDAKLVAFAMNKPQTYLHGKLEAQLQKTGKVRALVLKGRQQGISTYVAARYYHKASMRRNINVFIMAHEQAASDSLFSIVDRYQQHNPMRPSTGAANVKELEFDKLGSSYIVATAGQKASGRSRTFSLYHGSEVAFWNNATAHFASSIQAVPEVPGTEIILESTAFGPMGEFYKRWQEAVAGESEYEAIFIPWFYSSEYARPDLVVPGFALNTARGEDEDMSEADYAQAFGLSLEQMAWRRSKIKDLGVRMFRQEYPAYAEEAFQSANTDSYIESSVVLKARKNKDDRGYGPLIMGVDPAGPGGDRFSVALRRGHVVEMVVSRNKVDAVEAVEWVHALIQKHAPDEVNIDSGGLGQPVIAFLREKDARYYRLINAVNFGAQSQAKRAQPKMPGPKNRRAEMWTRLKEWLESETGASIPDNDSLHADLVSVTLKPTTTNDILLLSKEEMRSKGLRSPDEGDCVALTFANNRIISNWSQPSDPVSPAEPDRIAASTARYRGAYSWMA